MKKKLEIPVEGIFFAVVAAMFWFSDTASETVNVLGDYGVVLVWGVIVIIPVSMILFALMYCVNLERLPLKGFKEWVRSEKKSVAEETLETTKEMSGVFPQQVMAASAVFLFFGIWHFGAIITAIGFAIYFISETILDGPMKKKLQEAAKR